jgi:hypothetical protein
MSWYWNQSGGLFPRASALFSDELQEHNTTAVCTALGCWRVQRVPEMFHCNMVANTSSACGRLVSRPIMNRQLSLQHSAKGRCTQIPRFTETHSRGNVFDGWHMLHMMYTQPADALGGPSRGFVYTWRLSARCTRHGERAPGTRRSLSSASARRRPSGQPR